MRVGHKAGELFNCQWPVKPQRERLSGIRKREEEFVQSYRNVCVCVCVVLYCTVLYCTVLYYVCAV